MNQTIINKLLILAKAASKDNNFPIASVLVKNNEIVATQESAVATHNDPTAHSDLLLIQNYCRNKKLFELPEYELFTVFEPSLLGIGACTWAKVPKLHYIIPAERYYKDLQWCTESLELDKSSLANSFDNPVELIHHQDLVDLFSPLFEAFIERSK